MLFQSINKEITPLVSVVICSYNRQNTIVQTIESVLNQERDFSIEILIGDDGSDDNTREILQNYYHKYPELFTLLFHEENQGIGKNWASVMQLVKGKYVALCDDDDYWHYNLKLKKQIEILENDESIGLVHTNFRQKSFSKFRFIEIDNSNTNDENSFQLLFDGNYKILTSSVVFRNDLIKKHVNLDDYFRFEFPIQDWETWMLIAKYTKFYHLPICTVTYLFTPESVSRSNNFNNIVLKYKKEKIMYKYICDKFSEDLIYDENRYDKHVLNILLHYSYTLNNYEKANEMGKKLNDKTFKVFCSKNKILFKIYQILRNIKNTNL